MALAEEEVMPFYFASSFQPLTSELKPSMSGGDAAGDQHAAVCLLHAEFHYYCLITSMCYRTSQKC